MATVINVELGQTRIEAEGGRVNLTVKGPDGEDVTISMSPIESLNAAQVIPDRAKEAGEQSFDGPLAKMTPLFTTDAEGDGP